MLRFRDVIIAIVASVIAGAAHAATPKNALGAIAVSPNGKTVLAAGDNRVLYVLNANKLSVKKSIWIGVNPLSIHYAKKGGTIAIHDTTNGLTFYDTKTWKPIAGVADAVSIAVAEKAHWIIAAGRTRGRGENAETSLYAYDLATGKQVLSVKAKTSVQAIGALTDASRIFALSRPIKTEDEKTEKPPANLKGEDRDKFRQEHDGRVSQFVTFGKDGKEIGRYTTWYSSTSFVQLVALGKIDPGTDLQQHQCRSRSYRQADPNCSRPRTVSITVSAIRSPTAGWQAAGFQMVLSSISPIARQLPSRSTRSVVGRNIFKGFATARNGTIYGGTSAYRLAKIAPDGAVIMVVPVY